MKEVIKYIEEKLSKNNIYVDVATNINDLIKTKKINEFMTPTAIYNAFLLHLGKSEKIFNSLLNNTYLFDIEVKIIDREHKTTDIIIKKKLLKSFEERIEYIYVNTQKNYHFVGIKLNKNGYLPVPNYNGTEDTIPYYLITTGLKEYFKKSDFKWSEIIFGFNKRNDIHEKYVELIQHIKSLRMPVSIIYDESFYIQTHGFNLNTCYIHCSSNDNWPKDSEAVKCAKAALYCYIQKKSKYAKAVNYDYVLLRYKGFDFKVQILLKNDKKLEYQVNTKIQETIESSSPIFKKNIMVLKQFLGRQGYYPVYLDDRLIEISALIFGRNISSYGKFFMEFLDFNFEFEGLTLNLETLKLSNNGFKHFDILYNQNSFIVTKPAKNIIKRLNSLKKIIKQQEIQLFNTNLIPTTDFLTRPAYTDYDFVLSKSYIPDSLEIKNSETSNFELRSPCYDEVITPEMKMKAFLFYSAEDKTLMVKCKDDEDIEMLFNIIILRTNFNYALKNF